MAKHNDLGILGEQIAMEYLINKKYSICECDWQFGKRDIDIIAYTPQHNIMVFVEVKTRSDNEITDPKDAVNKKKAKSVAIAANAYVKQHDITDELRFDIISIIGTNKDNCIIEHIEDAFNPMLL